MRHLRSMNSSNGGWIMSTDHVRVSNYTATVHIGQWGLSQIRVRSVMPMSYIISICTSDVDWLTTKLLLALDSTVILSSHGTHGHILMSNGLGSLETDCCHWERLPKFEVRSYFTTVSQSVSTFWCRAPFGTCDQILLPVGMLVSEICGFVSVVRPLWREDGSVICNAMTQWSESRRTRNHSTLLSHLNCENLEG
jgi:hypothetical protein